MKYISAIFLLVLVTLCPEVHSQGFKPGVILAIKIAQERADNVFDDVNYRLRGLHDPAAITALETCLLSYREVRTNLADAVAALQANQNAEGFVSTALNKGHSCPAPAVAPLVAGFVGSCTAALDAVKNTKM